MFPIHQQRITPGRQNGSAGKGSCHRPDRLRMVAMPRSDTVEGQSGFLKWSSDFHVCSLLTPPPPINKYRKILFYLLIFWCFKTGLLHGTLLAFLLCEPGWPQSQRAIYLSAVIKGICHHHHPAAINTLLEGKAMSRVRSGVRKMVPAG